MNYYRYQDTYPFLERLKTAIPRIKDEVEAIIASKWTDWPEKDLYEGKEWKIIPFKGFGKIIKSSRDLCPFTYDLTMSLPGVETALISRVPAGMKIAQHRGWAELANRVLRCHIVIQTNNKCSLVVGGESRRVRPGHVIVFDDSKMHHASNEGDTDKIVLILDFPRPHGIPKGKSDISKTPSLVKFLESFESEAQ